MLNGKLWTDVENPNSFYLGNFSRMEYVRGRIYYSTPTGVNSILPDGSGDRVEYTLTNAESTRLYGFAYSDGIFYGEITPTPNPNGEIIKLDIELTEPVQIYGDINGDGQVNLEDAIMIQNILFMCLSSPMNSSCWVMSTMTAMSARRIRLLFKSMQLQSMLPMMSAVL